MTTESSTHPAKDQLIAFGQGKLAADESSSVEQHLEVCHECCETLLDLKDDTFVGLVKIAQPSDSDRRMGTLARPEMESSKTESNKTGTGKSAHPTDSAHSATLLVQSGAAVNADELPAELRDHPRYRIVELIGRGGMGNVYRAEHRLMNRPVAIKLINSQLIRQPQAVERFRREVQAAAKLTHSNIVTAYDAEQAGDVHFLVMEFVEGTDLASVVKHRGPMSVAEACECIRQAAEGLQHAHEKGMVHRDIKPHNLMLSAEGQVRILDFGLAGFATETALGSHVRQNVGDTHVVPPSGDGGYDANAAHLTTAGSVMGTPDYIAPEQAKDAHSADIRADIYSLGCTLHFLLTGKPPFEADSVLAKLKAHAQQSPTALTTLRNDVPTELSQVVARMMSKNPAERFQTPADVAEALAPFAKPAMSPPRRRARTLVAALWMGLVALLAGVIFVQTDTGLVEIHSEVDNVKISIQQKDGGGIEFHDLQTGSLVRRLSSGDYEVKLKSARNDVEIVNGDLKLKRWGKAVVTLRRKTDVKNLADSRMSGQAVKDVAEIRRFEGHEGPVRAIAWTPDGKALLSGSGFPTGDQTLRLWDSATGREIRQLTGHQGQVFAVDINRDGNRVLAACEKSIHLWDLTTGQYLRELRGHSADVTTVIFLPDGRHALSACHDKTVKLWDLESGTEKREFTGHTGATFGLAVLPGNRQFLSGSWDGTIRLWDLETGESLRTFTGHATWCVKMLPDGLRFLSSGDDGTVRLWEISSGKQLRKIKAHERQVFAMDVSPDGQLVASGGDGLVSLWNVETGEQLAGASHREFVWTVAFAPDGKSLLSAGGGGWKSENWHNGDDWVIRLWRRPEQPNADWTGWPKDAPPPAIARFDAEQAKQHQAAWAKHLGVRVEYTNSIGMKFRLIPPGEYVMGSKPEEVADALQIAGVNEQAQALAKSEAPQHKVILTQPIYLGVHEVTQQNYESVIGTNPSIFAKTGSQEAFRVNFDTSKHPVENVSWNDAAEFCAKLSENEKLKPWYSRTGETVKPIEGTGYRLPTEAEWEFACRGGTTTRSWVGGVELKDEDLSQAIWIGDQGGRTHPVGELKTNPFGMYDIHGNVWEWVQDAWSPTYYGQFTTKPAIDPSFPFADGLQRVLRGGVWPYSASGCRSSFRHAEAASHRRHYFGFRVALPVDAVRRLSEKPAHPPNAIIDAGRFTGHEGSVSHAIVSPGGRYGISCGADKTIRVWDIATQEEKRVLKGHEGSVFGLAISADGKLLASGDKAKSIRLWNLETGEQVGELTGHTDAVTDLAFMPDRTHLLSAGFDDTLRLWHVADRKLVKTIDIGTKVEKMIPLLDGRRVMLSGAHTRGWGPTTYDLEQGEKINATPNAYSCMAVSADGRLSLIGSITGVLVVRDTVNEKVIVQMTDPRAKTARDAAARDAAITPDGRFAITTTREKQMHLWDLHQGKVLSTAELDSISTISLSPDGRFALTIGNKGGVGVWRLPESVLEPLSAGPSDDVRMQSKRAQPAALTPPPALKLGVNLVTDPSLEETALGQRYPNGWGTGNVNPPDSFKHRVAEGGRTGQRGWLIEGDGQFAVIPTNRPPAHPAYRYAASAWVRVEAGSAQIKLLYFDANGQYLGENRGNVSIQQGDWHKLTMVDDLKRYPEARSLSLALTMVGQGKAVFDDLELLAFDANKLPEKFEATYGAASHSADVFDRWVGRWESTTTYAPTAVTPNEPVLKGETIVRKVLDDRFLLWQWSSDDGQSQYLTLLCFDDNIQAYHIWLFGSGGEVFDRTGQWNAASQTLTLQVKPSSPGVTGTSTDRFVSQDRIESTLLVKGSGGEVTRDMRATWIRKSKPVEDEIALADGRTANVSELAVLQKMVGRWSIRQTIKPCIAFPQGDQATGTEHNAWVLGGRFFLNRAYDDQQRMTSLALQTYDPVEKTFRHWHFAKDVFGGQWRVTWDASSRAFHWRSIDMPAGWIGTGFNRWINDDTFDNQALIKDETGRTIIDSKQDKRRKKS